MNRLTTRLQKRIQNVFWFSLMFVSTAIHAAPGTLADSPLFLGTSVQPNVFIMIDDSGSMDWEVISSNEAQTIHGYSDDWEMFDFTPNTDEERLQLCHGYNVLAYNPGNTYTAWAGKDEESADFADQVWPNARPNPHDDDVTVDLTNHYYMVWNDDGDSVYEDNECPYTAVDVDTVAKCQALGSAICVALTDGTAAQKINYANWYSYYRNREYVAKRALSEVINNSSARMGLKGINNQYTATEVKDIDDISTPVDATAQANKATLLSNLVQGNSSGGTPLRTGLEYAGEYYDNNTPTPESWATPILSSANGGACQQNFTLLMTDGYYNGSDPSVGNTDGGTSDSDYDGGSHADTYSNTLADVAMEYYEGDLDGPTALTNLVPTSGDDLNPAQHMVTYTVSFGVDGTLSSNPSDRTTAFTWPDPDDGDAEKIDDMRHAAWNGRGMYLSAANPQSLIDSLATAFDDIDDRAGTAAAVSFNTSTLESNSFVYLSLFDSTRWSGKLQAYALNGTTGAVSPTASWDAATKLDAVSTSSRVIMTHGTSDGVAFQWANLTTTQKNDLKTNTGGTADNDATGMARMGYIRGDRVCEVNSSSACSYTNGTDTYTTKAFRQRDSRLGDLVHSGSVYVDAAINSYPDGSGSDIWPSGTDAYSTFISAQANRKGIIYIGSNDGMLHAFRGEESSSGAGDEGQEVLGYIPSNLFSNASATTGLHYLTNPAYVHRYYVDLTPTVADAYIKAATSDTSAAWRSVLVGGQRGGGRGLFALDVTDASNFTESGTDPAEVVLWEFTDTDLGNTFSRPRIVYMENSRWAAIIGNGYNDSGSSGNAQLFIIFLDGGIDGTWTDGSGASDLDYIKIDVPVSDDGTNPNGLATPAVVDMDGDGAADRIYAGDLKGNMWVFDVDGTNTSQWGSAYKQGSTPEPLFTAKDSGGTVQPITSEPTIVIHPTVGDSGSNAPNTLVMFGTGQYLTTTDKTSTGVQTFYGVWDEGSKELLRADLQEQTFETVSITT
ncbi:MAG: hypothetical protein KAR30_01330, partial [Gammaproteobacteria bacterium]|nr:hypothetical protein [Gammaproteobacteria bacterium]